MNGLILTITSIIMRTVSMAFNIYVSNKIGAEAIGLFGLVMSVYLFFITIATSGLSLACTYLVSELLSGRKFLPEHFAKKQYLQGLKISKTCIYFGLVLGLISSCILLVLSNTISRQLA